MKRSLNSGNSSTRHSRQDHLFHLSLKGLSVGVLTLFALLLVFLFRQSWPAIQEIGVAFLSNTVWAPNLDKFTLLPFVVGTLSTSFIALMIAIPISVTTALFITELAPTWIRGPLSFLVEMLAAIPSVVYGLWGIFYLAPWIRNDLGPTLHYFFGDSTILAGPIRGVGILCAGILLAIMIIPTITTVCREVFKAVPRELREGALALGATQTEMIHEAVVKSGSSGILGASILGLGRALGETMAVTMVIGNRSFIPHSLFDAGSTMSSIIANELAEADALGLHLPSLTLIGLSLFFVALFVNLGARLLIKGIMRRNRARS